MNSIKQLAFMYAMTGASPQKEKYGQSVWKLLVRLNSKEDGSGELKPNWKEYDALRISDASIAHAIAYDWCYDRWTVQDRETIKRLMYANGITFFNEAYHGDKDPFWTHTGSNWGLWTCAGAIALGVSLDEWSTKGSDWDTFRQNVVLGSLKAIEYGIDQFQEDKGGWWEGTDYHSVSMMNLALFMAGIESSTNLDMRSYYDTSSIRKSASFAAHLTGYSQLFSYSHSTKSVSDAPEQFWYAGKFADNGLLRFRLDFIKNTVNYKNFVEDLIWYTPKGNSSSMPNILQSDYQIQYGKVAVVRDAASKTFFATKAGRSGVHVSHSQLDHGDFVFDSGGVRFVETLRRDPYDLHKQQKVPGIAGIQKFMLYRERAEGHNVLIINPNKIVKNNPSDPSFTIKTEKVPQT